jgi:DNA-binding transcriptional ArsR family regulator
MTAGIGISDVILRLPVQAGEKLLLALMENLSRKSGLAYASVETYATRIGSNPRTVRRLLRNLERRGVVILERPGGGRSRTAAYRLNLRAEKPGQVASVSDALNADRTGRKPGQSVRANPDKSGRKPGQVVPQVVMSIQDSSLQGAVRGCAAAPASTPLCADGERPKATAQKTKSAHAELVAHWCAKWKETYHAAYPFTKRDAAHVQQVVTAAGGDLARAKGIVGRYLACGDKWYTERGHKLGLLIADLPRFLSEGAGKAGPVRPGELPYAGADKPLPRALAGKPAGA